MGLLLPMKMGDCLSELVSLSKSSTSVNSPSGSPHQFCQDSLIGFVRNDKAVQA